MYTMLYTVVIYNLNCVTYEFAISTHITNVAGTLYIYFVTQYCLQRSTKYNE